MGVACRLESAKLGRTNPQRELERDPRGRSPADMGACCGRPSGAACSQLAAAGLLLSAADWALLRGRGVTGAAAVLALGDEGLGCARALQLRSDPSCFYSASWGLPSADVRFARPVIC